MRPYALRFVLVLIVALAAAWALSERPAHADAARTPTLASLGLRVEAEEELRALVLSLPPDARAKVPGVYVAFAENAADVAALAACDDDGDYVIVLSTALLTLLEHATHAVVLDEMGAEYKLWALADHYAREQRDGARLLPPPASAFDFADSRIVEVAHTQRFRQALAGVLARELAPMLAGDYACAHPTQTRERGDDVWTREEDDAAQTYARTLYGSRTRNEERDASAIDLLRGAGHEPLGYLAWLAFMARIEDGAMEARWSYARLHKNARARHTQAVLKSREKKD